MRKMHQPSLFDSPQGVPDAETHTTADAASVMPPEGFEATLAQAQARLAAVNPTAYARTRNALNGAVTGLSPYLTHGLLSLREVLAQVDARHRLPVEHKFVYELGWRAFFRHVWAHRGAGIVESLHEGPLPDSAYARVLPDDIRQGATGVPVIDQAVRTLYGTGYLHNHARMWLASYVVHLRKVHWRAGADWMLGHLLDGDLASNHLSWQWVAGTGSHKPYLFNAENVARFAPPAWHSPGTVIDTDYETLDRWARGPSPAAAAAASWAASHPSVPEPVLMARPPADLGFTPPDAATVQGRVVCLLHPWALGEPPAHWPADALRIGMVLDEAHAPWPWSEARWRFVGTRMAEITPHRWVGTAAQWRAALQGAQQVLMVREPHLPSGVMDWAPTLSLSEPDALFPPVDRPCHSFSQWWRQATRGLGTAEALWNTAHEAPIP